MKTGSWIGTSNVSGYLDDVLIDADAALKVKFKSSSNDHSGNNILLSVANRCVHGYKGILPKFLNLVSLRGPIVSFYL